MAEVYPFIGTRYNSQLIGNLGKVVSPPCDGISSELQATLYERHEHNVVRLESAGNESEDEEDGFSNRYTRAANTFGTWRSDGVFIEDEKPSFYLYEQIFTGPDGERYSRAGFLAKVKLEENTCVDVDAIDDMCGSRADYLNLLRSTRANISAVTSLFQDSDNAVMDTLHDRMKEKPWEETNEEEGVIHRLWVVQKKEILLKLVEAMKSRNLFIAEGQQRYTTAQIYRDEMRLETGKSDGKQPYDYVMMLLLPAEQDGILFTPTHRALTKSIMADVELKDALEELSEHFEIHKGKIDITGGSKEAQRIQTRLQEFGQGKMAVALAHAAGTAYYLVLKDKVQISDLYDSADMPECVGELDVCVLHNYIINQVLVGNPEYELEDDECLYATSAGQILELLKTKKAVCGFLLNSLSVPRMLDIANTGVYVPLDIGVLNPRPATGLVLRNLQTDARKSTKR